ncbi:MAG: hypothetical protein GYA23_02170, partial [Methanomicrobiales archaeon]|nr:hypothetical protein [Methanomicrobiales archaeon]
PVEETGEATPQIQRELELINGSYVILITTNSTTEKLVFNATTGERAT